ncbi:WD40/YVTN/BNR-like repeat-containing protein [Chloroflexota bacterium]
MKKLTKLFGVGLVVILLVSLFGFAAPASAGTLKFEAEDIPDSTGKILVTTNAIKDMAVSEDGQTIWVVTGTTTAYRSTNGGSTWSSVTLDAAADLVAIAPEDTDMVVTALTSGPSAYLTTNAGSSFATLGTIIETSGGTAALAITDLAISPVTSGKNYVAVAGTDAGGGNIWYFDVGSAAPKWIELDDKPGYGATVNVSAIAWSPNHASDRVLVAVTDNASGSADLQIFSSSTKKWNAAAAFEGYPADIVTGVTDIYEASITLAPTYLGSDDTEMIAFVGLNTDADTASGIYRMKNTTTKELKDSVNINSVAYDGTNLVAGAQDTNYVYYCADPLDTSPTVSTARALKRPGINGTGNESVQVAWSGDSVIAVTDGAEGAFAVSDTNGKTFNDISLISSNITDAQDVAVAPDGSVAYFVTDDNAGATTGNTSVWRQTDSDWKRVLSLSQNAGYIVRIAPDDPNSVYVAQKGGTTVYYSADGGLDKWFTRTCGVTIVDLAVESADVAYAIDSGGDVSKSVNGGFTWGSVEASKASSAYTIVSVQEDVILVGGTLGYAAYSLDGNDSWKKITKILQSGATNIVVTADADYANNNTIYAATTVTGKNVKRFVIGESDDWTDIFYVSSSETSIGNVYGLTIYDGGLYALTSNGTQSSLWQCLTPLTASSSSAKWAEKVTTSTSDDDDSSVVLGSGARSNQGLIAGGGKLWAVKTNGTNKLYSFTDTLNNGGPAMIGPADLFQNKVNNVTGKANEVQFTWERLSKATEYKLYIAYDAGFDESVTTITVDDDGSTVVQSVGPERTGTALVNWQLGETYYWRVKVTAPLYSSYGETRSFTVEPGVALVPTVLAPANGASESKQKPSFSWSPVSGTAKYRFVLANNPALTAPIVDITTSSTAYAMTTVLAYGETYYWAVKSIEPVEGAWSAIANLSVMDAPVAPTPPIVIEQVPAPVINLPPQPAPPPDIIIPPAPPAPAQIAPAYIWAIIIIGAILVIAVIILIVRTRRTV